MAFDFKKEYKSFYLPPGKPGLIDIPAMNFIAVRGEGNPNDPDGEYAKALGLLYAVAYTLKMSYKGPYRMDGFFEYVVPPLEGFWWMDGRQGIDYRMKDAFKWISVIRVPDFVHAEDVQWAVAEASRKKKLDCSPVTFFPYTEGLCVQCMHTGSFDDEPATIEAMEAYARDEGYAIDITATRYHHEIYLNDARKVAPDKLKTVIRHPVRRL